jgi:hypothetical protein
MAATNRETTMLQKINRAAVRQSAGKIDEP